MDVINNKSYTRTSIAFDLYIIGFLTCIAFMLMTSNPQPQIIGFTVLVIFALIILKVKNYKLFFAFFITSIIISRLLVYQFYQINGTPYIGGGDDKMYNDLALYFTKNNIDISDPLYLAISYKLYLYILSKWIVLLNAIGGYNVGHSYHTCLIMLNSFFGALSMIVLKKILITINKYKEITNWKYVIVFFNPLLLYYSSVLLREILIVLLILYSIYVILSTKSNIYKLFLVLLCLIAVFLIRPANSFIIVLASSSYLFVKVKSNIFKGVVISLAFIIIVAFIVPNINNLLGRDIAETQKSYSELGSEQASSNSVGAKLLNSSNYIIKAILPVYILLSPIPPPILTDYNLKSLLISVSSIFWVFTLIVFIQVSIENYRNANLLKENAINYYTYFIISIIILFFNSIVVGFTSLDPRHHILLYPLITPIALISINDKFYLRHKYYFSFIIVFIFILILIYLLFKF